MFVALQLTTDECWLQTPASDIPDLLHLAVNSQKPEAAQGLLQLMRDEPAYQLQRLCSLHHQKEQNYNYSMLQQLQAYQLRGWSVSHTMQQEMQQALSAVQQRHQQEQQQLCDRPQQLKQLLTTDLVVELLHTAALRGHWAVIGGLFELDAAQSISADTAAKLLHAAVQRHSVVGLEVINKHQAAKQVSADALRSLMQSALQTAFQGAWPLLLQPSAAESINTAGVLQLLKQAVGMRDSLAVRHLCTLRSASAVSAESIVKLLQLGLTRSFCEVLIELADLPGALLIPTGSMVVLLQTAIQQANIAAVEDLIMMDIADELDAQQLGQLCKLAMAMAVGTDSTCLDLLLRLPSTDDFDDSQVDDLVEAALQQSKRNLCYNRSSCDNLRAIVQLPAAHDLRPSLICESLEHVLDVSGTDGLIDLLCSLENADALKNGSFASNNALHRVILTALQLRRFAAARSISQLTNFNDVSTAILQDLLSAAIEQQQEDLAVKMCDGAAAQMLPCSAVVRLLHVATRQRLCRVVGCLLVLDAGADICADQMAGLIKEELNTVDSWAQYTVSDILTEYIAHDAAALMPWSQVADLMCLAICKRKDRAVVQLCRLAGAQDAHASRLVNLVLHVAWQRDQAWMQPLPPDSFIIAVCQLPAAHHMNASILKSLMEAAVRSGRPQSLLQLCQLPAAAELDGAAVAQLILSALHCGTASHPVAAVLSTLPGAALTTRQDVLLMLQTAIARGEIICALAMLGCEVGETLLSRSGSFDVGAAEKLLTEDVAALLLMCLDREAAEAPKYIEALSKLPAAEHLSLGQVSSCLRIAIQLGFDAELQSLCVLHEKVLGPMSEDLICKLFDLAETCTPDPTCNRSAKMLEILRNMHKKQKQPGFVFGLQ